MSRVSVFTYGTLMVPEVMEALTDRDLEATDAVLRDHVRHLLAGRIYPGVVAAAGTDTPGRLYRDVDPRSLAVLDLFEGDTYERRTVEVDLIAGERVAAEAYIVAPGQRHLLTGRAWDEADFRARYLADYVARCRVFGARERALLGRR